MSTHATPRTLLPLVPVLCGLGLLGTPGLAQAANWKAHGTDAALEAAQMTGSETLDQAFAVADTVNDTAATAFGANAAAAVLGKSGPAILTSLKAAGGPVASGSALGFGVAGLQDKFLYSDCTAATACDVAAVSGYVGAGLGTATAVGLGATYGVGAAGLAGIGTLIGGGMAAGAMTLIALPAVAAVAVAGGAYLATTWVLE